MAETVAAWVANAAAAVATNAGASAAAAATVHAVAYYGTQVAISVALSAAASALSQGTPDSEAVQGSKKQPVPPRIRGGGRRKIGGWYVLWEAKENRAYDVLYLMEGPIQAVERVWSHDKMLTLNGSKYVVGSPDYGGGNSDLIHVDWRLGAPIETAYAPIVSGLPGVWTSSCRGDGVASLGADYRHAKRENLLADFPHGDPDWSVTVLMNPIWDPRDEAADREDPSTWGGTKSNLALLILDHCLHATGMAMDWETEIAPAIDHWMAEADICDEDIPLAAGGTEKRYWGSYYCAIPADPQEALDKLLAACDGKLLKDQHGVVRLWVGKYRAPTVTLTDADIVDYDISSDPAAFDACNEIVPRFVSEAENWTLIDTTAWQDPEDIARRGRVMSMDLPLEFSHSGPMSRRVGKAVLLRQLAPLRGQLQARLSAVEALGQRWIAVDLPDLGLSGAVIEVEDGGGIAFSRGTVDVSFVLANPQAYDWDAATEEKAVDLVPRPPIDEPPPVSLTGVAVTPLQLTASETGAVQPGVLFTWTAPVDTEISAIRAEIRLQGSTNVSPTTTEDVDGGRLPVTQGVLAGAWIQARLVPVTRSGRAVVSSPWTLVRVGRGVSDDLTPTGPGRRRVLSDQLDEARARFDADMVAEAEADGNETLTRGLVDVLAEVNPVQRRALLRAGELDLEGSSLDLLGLATRGELGLGPDGEVLQPLSPEVIDDSDLVVQLELSDAVDGLEGQIGLVASDVVTLGEDLALAETTLQGEIDAVELVVGGLDTDLLTLTGDLAALSDDLALAETTLQGEIDAVELTVGGHTTDLATLGSDLAAAETALQGEIDAVETTVTGHTTQLGVLDTDLTALAGDLAAAETALQGEIDAVETTVTGHTTQLGTLDTDLTALAGDLAAAETALGAEIDALDTALGADLLALEVAIEDGSVVPLVAGGLTASATKALASGGSAPVPVKWFEVQAAHGEMVGFDRDYGTAPIVLSAENNILPTPTRAGEYLNLRPSSITGESLTGRALMVYPGTDPVYDDQLDDDPSGKSVDGVLGSWAEFHKATDTVAFNGQYTATVEVRLDGEPDPGTPTQSTAGVPMTLGLQGRRTDVGLWVDFGEATYYSLAGSLNVLRDVTITGTAPPEWDTWNTHSATEYRVEIKAGGDTTYRRITDFIQVEYTYLDTPGSGAESNPALPSGQKITYLVFPRG